MAGSGADWPAGRSVQAMVGGAVAVAYVAMAWLGSEIGSIGTLTVWYPPAGLAMVGGLLVGWWMVPFAAAGELVASVLVFDVHRDFSAPQLLLNALGYGTIWATAGVVLRRATRVDLRRLTRGVLLALVTSAVVAPFAAACWGVAMQRWAGIDERSLWEAVYLWSMGDAVGATSLAPSLSVLAFSFEARRRRVAYEAFPGGSTALTLLLLVSPMAVAAAVFLPDQDLFRFAFLIVVPVVLVAVWRGVEGAALATLGLTPVVTILARASEAAVDRAALQALLLVSVAAGLVVGAITSDRLRIARMHRELGAVIEHSPDLVMIVDVNGRVTYLNPAARAAVGLGADDPLDAVRDVELLGGGLLGQMGVSAREAAFRDGQWRGEVAIRTVDGRELRGSALVVAQPERVEGRLATRAATVIRDISELRALEEQVARDALHDRVTGLPNHTLFREHVAQARRRSPEMAVIVARAHRLRHITEGAGVWAAEQAVAALAVNLVETAGTGAIVARLSTDTFGVLLDAGIGREEATALARRIIEVAESTRTPDGLPVSVAVGIAAGDTGARDADELIRFAQVAVGRAAVEGRAVLYTAELSDAAERLLQAETELREGLDPDRWWLDYQPIVDVPTGRIAAVEALLRWRDRDGAPQSPYDLILLAEQTGAIVALGEAILERACREARRWEVERAIALDVAVNVSARQLADPAFASTVRAVLDRTGFDPRRLSLEVTETAFVGDLVPVRANLHELIALGVAVAMDDFGTGYSSLAQLSGLPISTVKLDGTFTGQLADPRGRELVRGVITLAHALSLSVVAEFVEDHQQLDVLRALGCDRAQGFLLSPPLSEPELVEVISTRPVLV